LLNPPTRVGAVLASCPPVDPVARSKAELRAEPRFEPDLNDRTQVRVGIF
jgi:hypothetical protein